MKWWMLLFVIAAPTTVFAEEPWEQGVAQSDQDTAEALFAEGNVLFGQQAHAAALEKFSAAVALWNHPVIRFNMAITEIRLDRILEAAADLDAALRFGDAPFSADQYRQVLDYQRLVAGRVGTIEASCEQSDVAITLDGKPWFACPGTQHRQVLAGEHLIVGERAGFMTASQRVVVAGDSSARATISLVPISSLVKLEYPTPRWIPVSVGGAGLALGLAGVGIWFSGRSQMDSYEARLETVCARGCSPGLDASVVEQQLAEQRDSARLKGRIALGAMIAGAALTAGGAVWFVANRPKRILPQLEVAPASNGATALARWRF